MPSGSQCIWLGSLPSRLLSDRLKWSRHLFRGDGDVSRTSTNWDYHLKKPRRKPRILWRGYGFQRQNSLCSGMWRRLIINEAQPVSQSSPSAVCQLLLFLSFLLLLLWSLTCSKLSRKYQLIFMELVQFFDLSFFFFLNLKNIISLLWVKSLREQLP